ncbi:MAG: T9SS type A sorting domain-containing protein, partial [Sphingobacteriales bacterium]
TVQIPVTVNGCPGGVPSIPTVPGAYLCNGGGSAATLTATGGGANVSTYKWYPAANSATAFFTGSTYTTPVLTATTSYYVSAITAQGCESPRRRVNVVVAPVFTVAATASPSSILAGSQTNLSATATTSNVTYSWVGPYLSSNSGSSVTATPLQSGTFTYTVYGKIGTCTSAPATVQVSVFVAIGAETGNDEPQPDPEAKLRTTGFTSESPEKQLSVLVYPNPFATEIAVQIKETSDEKVEVTLRDLSGRIVYFYTAGFINPMIPLQLRVGENLAQGVYLLHLSQGEKEAVVKIVKQ